MLDQRAIQFHVIGLRSGAQRRLDPPMKRNTFNLLIASNQNVLRSFFLGGLAFGLFVPGLAAPIDPSLYSGLKWRNIGPFRGGRVAAVTGVIGQPGVFYAGLPLGGVWKTTSAGVTWQPIFDSVK